MKYEISPKYCVRDIMGDCVVIPINGSDDGENRLFSVNQNGKIILDCISEGKQPEEIAKLFSEQYGIAICEALNDINEFINGFAEQGIIISSD